MFSIVRQGSAWVLRADGADILVVRSKALARKLVRDASGGGRRPPAARCAAPARAAGGVAAVREAPAE